VTIKNMRMMFTTSLIAAALTTVLFTAPAAYAQLIDISPVNAASASNSDDDVVVQANSANVKQKADVDCEAKVSDDDKYQVGYNINAAGNDCDTTQTTTVAQANVNQDNDVQVAEATACQAVAGLIGANVCDNLIHIDVPEGPPEEGPVWCHTAGEGSLVCYETEGACDAASEACQEYPTRPPGCGPTQVPGAICETPSEA
jgi:hypothetical protein